MADEILVIPPIRQSLEDINSARGNGIAQPLTEKSWYLYWHRLGEQVNALQQKSGGTGGQGGISTQSQPPRVLQHDYQNTNSTALFVLASCRLYYVAGYSEIAAFTDAGSHPQTRVGQATNYGANSDSAWPDIAIPLMFIVLPNNYYRLDLVQGAGTVENWTEWF